MAGRNVKIYVHVKRIVFRRSFVLNLSVNINRPHECLSEEFINLNGIGRSRVYACESQPNRLY